MKTKHILTGHYETREVFMDGKHLSPTVSQQFRNHSPDGFNWGYGGSGPAQLALAVMIRATGKTENYQELKFKVIAALPKSDFEAEITLDQEQNEYSFILLSQGE